MDIEFDLQKMLLRTNQVIQLMDSNRKCKPVLQYTLDGVFICKYDSMSEAEISGVEISVISRICNGIYKPKKYIFKYDTESLNMPEEPLDKLLDFL